MRIYAAMAMLAMVAILACAPSLARDRPERPAHAQPSPQGDTYKCAA